MANNELPDLQIETTDFIRLIGSDPEAFKEAVRAFEFPGDFVERFEEEFVKSGENLLRAFNHVIIRALTDAGLMDGFEDKLGSDFNAMMRKLVDAVIARHPVKDITGVSPRDFLKHYIGPVASMFMLTMKEKILDLYEKKLLMEELLSVRDTMTEFSRKLSEKDAKVGELTQHYEERIRGIMEEGPATDSLTGLQPRLRYERKIDSLKSGVNANKTFWVLCLDIDLFKSVNDTYGHATGDRVLGGLGKIIQRHTRDGDAYRPGGEEFVVIFDAAKMNRKAVEQAADSIRRGVESRTFNTDEGTPFRKTISIGIASGLGADIENTIKNADKAAYNVKHSGRNNIWVHGEDTPMVKRNGSRNSLPPQPSPIKAK